MKILEAREIGTGILIEREGYTNQIVTSSSIINEGVGNLVRDSKSTYIECILQKANVKNKNGRVYSKQILDRELQKYIQQVQDRNSFGEVCHPDRSDISLRSQDLGLLVVDFWWKNETLWGVIELLTSIKYDNDGTIGCQADYIADLLKKKCKLGISSRGLGSVKQQNGVLVVQSDFELIGWDLVSSPSTPDAYLYKSVDSDEIKNVNESVVKKQLTELENKYKSFLQK